MCPAFSTESTMKKLAIIGAGPMASIYAKRCRELGVQSHCFAWKKGATALNDVDAFHDVSVTDPDAIVRISREVGIDGVLPTTELTVYPTAYVAHELGLPGNDPEVARVLTNKFRNRRAVEVVEGLRQPKFLLVKDASDLDGIELSFPAIVKPTSEGGKRGITVVNDAEELSSALDYASSEKKDSSDIIVEEFIPEGPEYSVETLTWGGVTYLIQVTEKWSSGAPHCVELGHHQPARLEPGMRERIDDVMGRALAAIGLINGCCHTEIKICDGEIYLIEFNARPGGDHISYPLTELSSGYPYITGMIQIALGEFEEPRFDGAKAGYAGVCFVTEQTAALKPVFDDCQNHDWCYEKNEVSDQLTSLDHNRGYSTNYFIYYSKEARPQFLDEIGNAL